ncbi:MAG: glycoside hydrolase family 3 N-terminal domain-containing protein [Flavobacteriaceae bacterium]|nr:glycoside hydrolase family 3 N-terminal domain-containing protein [Flavobacteriaceae bacterium]
MSVLGITKILSPDFLEKNTNFDGIICTDWGLVSDMSMAGIVMKPASAHGVEHLSEKERVFKILDAGCDMFGGEAIPKVVIELVKEGRISEDRINASVKRILKEKFKLGLFDNPYLKTENIKILGNEKFIEKGRESQRRSLVLLKNENNLLPLKETTKVYLHGFDKEETKKYASVSSSLKEADVILLKINTPFETGMVDYPIADIFHQGRLDFPEKEKVKLLELIRSKPTITVINLERPAVIPEISAASKALIGDFSSQDEIIN